MERKSQGECPGSGEKRKQGKITKGHEETFGGDAYVPFLNGGDCVTDVHMCKNASNYIFKGTQ